MLALPSVSITIDLPELASLDVDLHNAPRQGDEQFVGSGRVRPNFPNRVAIMVNQGQPQIRNVRPSLN